MRDGLPWLAWHSCLPRFGFQALLLFGFSTSHALAVTYVATPSGGPGYDAAGREVAPKTRALDKAMIDLLQPGDTLQLLAETPAGVTVYSDRLVVSQKGTSNSPPITIKGIGARTKFAGKTIEALQACTMPDQDSERTCADTSLVIAGLSGGQRDLLVTLTEAAEREMIASSSNFAVPAFGSSGRLKAAACVDLDRVDGLILEDLTFEDCWLSAVRAVGRRRVTLRNTLIRGSSYGLAVKGSTSNPSDAITVEGVTWVQDTSGYAKTSLAGPQVCAAQAAGAEPRVASLGCPGRTWRTLPWGVTHHGVAEHYNGALLGGVDVSGNVVFRSNRVFSAYNGIRLKAKKCEELPASQLTPQTCRFNTRVQVEDNTFSYLRDNPVEMEVFSRDVVVARNRIHNAHAWFSFDDMGGGPVYIFGNTGWFDDMPALGWSKSAGGGPPCERHPIPKPVAGGSFDPALDRHFDYAAATWLPVALLERELRNGKLADVWMEEQDQRCDTSIAGRVLKFSLPDKGMEADTFRYPTLGPVYVFNNSWYLRAPVTGTGAAVHLRHWNNAILFCESGTPGYDAELCSPRPVTFDATCGERLVRGEELRRFKGATGSLPFFDCFRWLPVDEVGRERPDLASEFDTDVSSNGFPADPSLGPTFEARGRHGDPGFVAPAAGDFRLQPGALAAQSPCRVQSVNGGLACVAGDGAYAGAHAPDGTVYPGPGGL
ncbi:hypothetical protein [Microvirga arsenatis]|uniref:Right-handed parallel beta-helix repeat-containing protein n=1 Tax=Microvirga arsenatis TaxID=2692265 RepID=A0ABW9YV71_9HYPH|nr:hypothetical protein [Microvirga arsenatis]NBJ10939.1 hypothetical protein [Microvirga arsenatis]NBJ24164.1 hypothetical protein [Microvirga arsenatis]